MKYAAVIFDMFGTLVDNFSQESYRRVLTDMATVLAAAHRSALLVPVI